MITEKILVVDDESTICDSVKKILSRKGYSVENTLNATDAIEKMKKEKYDILITDLMMPKISGMELIELVKKYYPEIDVLVITGYATIDTAVQATKLGVLDYIQKPFTPNELTDRIQKAIELRKNRNKAEEITEKKENKKVDDIIDVDMPFKVEEIEKATSKDFVNKLTRSDIPISKKYVATIQCSKGSRECKIFTKTKMECKGECIEIKKEKKA
ncbi:MAG: response regulator, partial [Ignavibacteriae bacterium]|nr:response regulator [Ignavibacteriota bacterium]